MSFSEHLRHERKRNGLGLRELARRMECSGAYLSRLETGDEVSPPSEDWIRRWCAKTGANFNVTIDLSGRIEERIQRYLIENPEIQKWLREVLIPMKPTPTEIRRMTRWIERNAKGKPLQALAGDRPPA